MVTKDGIRISSIEHDVNDWMPAPRIDILRGSIELNVDKNDVDAMEYIAERSKKVYDEADGNPTLTDFGFFECVHSENESMCPHYKEINLLDVLMVGAYNLNDITKRIKISKDGNLPCVYHTGTSHLYSDDYCKYSGDFQAMCHVSKWDPYLAVKLVQQLSGCQ
jgi:hypothetical protein